MRKYPGVSADPNVMAGMPCIKGTRVTVANVVRQVAAGKTSEQICLDYPYLSADSIRDALEFAAAVVSSENYEVAS